MQFSVRKWLVGVSGAIALSLTLASHGIWDLR
jgi:hypothetical protein